MSSLFEIRDAGSDDYEAMFGLHEALFKEGIERIWGWDDSRQRENFADEWRTVATRSLFFAERWIGYVQLKEEADCLYLLCIAVKPEFQGMGIGRSVMAGLKMEAERCALPLRLSVFRSNPRAERFYEGLGFRVSGMNEDLVRMEWSPSPGPGV
jgi:ribosomal protein S18 acetylase RimI-like enzyme